MNLSLGRLWLLSTLCGLMLACFPAAGPSSASQAHPTPVMTLLLTANTYGAHSPCPT